MTGTTAARSVVTAMVAVTVAMVPTTAVTAPTPVQRQSMAQSGQDSARVTDTLRALDRLHAFGYTINTPARADRAIRHWQRANGLAVDGVVGPDVLASLGISTSDAVTASAPAVRESSPAGADPEAIIRAVWPDQLEDHAVAIAFRESRLVPTVRNACCFGLFQIHWAAHRSWLATIGVTSANQLFDAATNAMAAYQLFLRDGWSPWNL